MIQRTRLYGACSSESILVITRCPLGFVAMNTAQTQFRIGATRVAAFAPFRRGTPKAAGKIALTFFSFVLLLGAGASVRGQSALDGFDPNANGTVRVVVVQPDG